MAEMTEMAEMAEMTEMTEMTEMAEVGGDPGLLDPRDLRTPSYPCGEKVRTEVRSRCSMGHW